MKIREILAEEELILSFEVFPPKVEDTYDSMEKAATKTTKLRPSFMGVTYGAGGGTSDYTVGTASTIKEEHVATPLMHPICVSSTREEVYHVLGELKEHGIEGVLALQGDIPQDGSTPKEYHCAPELIREIRKADDFCIGVACYPEGHVGSTNKSVDMNHSERRVKAGCDFVITQMFPDNSILYSYLYRIHERGIQVPAIAGIMPVTNAKQIRRITQISGTCLPSRLISIVNRFGNSPAAMKQIGIAYATDQIIDLTANGVNGIRVYSMNRPDVAMRIKENLSGILQGDLIGPDTERENEHMGIHDIDGGEVPRYLGYRGQEADETVTTMVEQFMAELWGAAMPKHPYREHPLTLGEDCRIDGGCSKAKSKNLWRNLKNRGQIIVSTATLDCGADHLTQKYSHLQMSRAMVMQAAAATMIEGYCDWICTAIRSEYEAKNRYLRPRFSPDYRSFPLEYQGMFLRALEAGRRIGIRLVDSLLITPSRSIFTVMGASRKPYRCGVKSCETYTKTGCPYQRQ